MTNYKETILIVEDDFQIRNFISYSLRNEGYICKIVSTGSRAINTIANETVDLVILDLGLPDIDGIDVIRMLREWSEIPVIVVSARDQDREKAYALDLGADDYLTKPFSSTELLARIRVAVRHMKRRESVKKQSVIQVGGLSVDFEKRIVTLDGNEIHLTPMEYSLMSLLIKNRGKVVTTASVIKELWGPGYGQDTQALRTLMAGLRRKIEANPAKPRYIMTEIGVGYRMVEE
ncbi:MAG: response regulator transcription factor [Oscillospiraceae bacterium]|nr:response regulator transcription factor [Oscillospiraceae bacterium]MBQ6849838.1 response regulator transcription factor [Oscillospiraceae bacterium]MBR6609166.1 response regulator transcription factor [Oscillospiraceae bacterium]